MRELIQNLEFTVSEGEHPPIEPIAQKPQPMRDCYVKTLDVMPTRLDICVPFRFRGKRVKVVLEVME